MFLVHISLYPPLPVAAAPSSVVLRPSVDLAISAVDHALKVSKAALGEGSQVAAVLLQKQVTAVATLRHWMDFHASAAVSFLPASATAVTTK